MIKVFDTHWGGGYIEVYDIEQYRVVINYSTGSSIGVYAKENFSIENAKCSDDIWWSYCHKKPLSSGWWYANETVNEAIDRNIHQIEHSDQRIWFETLPKPEPGTMRLGNSKIHYEHGLTEERIKEIESDPNFEKWHK